MFLFFSSAEYLRCAGFDGLAICASIVGVAEGKRRTGGGGGGGGRGRVVLWS